MHATADRGGPFVHAPGQHAPGQARNWMRSAPPGIASHAAADESSPIGGGAERDAAVASLRECTADAVAPPARRVRPKRLLTLALGVIALGGAALLAEGVYVHVAQRTGDGEPPQPDAGTPVERGTWASSNMDRLALMPLVGDGP